MPELISTKVALRVAYSALLLLLVLLLPISSIRLDLDDVIPMTWLISVFAFLAIYGWYRNIPKLEMFCECAAVVIAGIFLLMILSYIAASFNQPLIDDVLWSLDKALGFDWPWFVRLLDSSALTMKVLTHAYGSMIFQLLLIPALLITIKQAPRAYVMLASFLTLAMVSCIVFIWTPAMGAFPTSGLRIADFANARMNTANFMPDLMEVRKAIVYPLLLEKMSGLISMPSVHAGAALICAWATWRVPVLKYVVSTLNIVMSIAAIILGGHYLVDIFAGWAVAALVIYAVLSFCRWYEKTRIARSQTTTAMQAPA
ncbi:phosphatase PAP2 family protein [Methylocella sp. CPCC 101449]|uniref:phosphatase PAP2 family protein n=1 Tax=Methylocella sp. CPCC 101449 TaxID=2987531 RepID=UPI00288F3173|nr:phosphatase PAP2 family protein [Methylocella sp. CPCC 101449]MDT2019368.1 phosphatase PAP2 family protein [Methylocella sp. CPCC 101449]